MMDRIMGADALAGTVISHYRVIAKLGANQANGESKRGPCFCPPPKQTRIRKSNLERAANH
jgi:hypothetical protein